MVSYLFLSVLYILEKEAFLNKETLKKIYNIDFEIIKNNEKFYIQIAD